MRSLIRASTNETVIREFSLFHVAVDHMPGFRTGHQGGKKLPGTEKKALTSLAQ